MTIELKSFDVRIIVKHVLGGTLQATDAIDAIQQAHSKWRTECQHPFERIDDGSIIDVTAAPASQPPGPPPLKHYRVRLEQPLLHTVTVVAPDETAAQLVADYLYQKHDGIVDYVPPDGWDVEWQNWSVVDVREVTP